LDDDFKSHDKEVYAMRDKLEEYEREGLRADKSLLTVLSKIQVTIERVETDTKWMKEKNIAHDLDTREYRKERKIEFDKHCVIMNARFRPLEIFRTQITTAYAFLTVAAGMGFSYLNIRGRI